MGASNREKEWWDFASMVAGHIDTYACAQYGDKPTDEVEQWDTAQCVDAIGKYVKRYQIMRRGRLETLRDMAKIAHFACLVFNKMNPSQDETEKILEGKV
jgi:hypothetical protein